ncbi:MAG: NADH-quinone oxidoreductase subunit F, partial [Propioniciclava sp.]
MTDMLTPVLSKNWTQERSWKIANYERTGGYQGLKKALKSSPADIISVVKDSGLRGRGGAGFPTGMKWSFVPKDNPNPKYLVVNADESEPGTCKDIPLMMATPHTLVEG